MRLHKKNAGLALLLAALLSLALAGCDRNNEIPQTAPDKAALPVVQQAHELVVLPDSGKKPLLDLINNASKNIDMVIYEIEDDSKAKAENIAAALTAAKQRGVKVRVIINGFNKANRYQKWAEEYFEKHRIDYRVATKKFPYTHQKTMIVDGAKALVGTFNYVDTKKTSYFGKTRDFGIITAEPGEVQEIAAVFDADWENARDGTKNTPQLKEQALLFSPVNAREKLNWLISNASKTLYLYQLELGDLNSKGEGLCSALAEAAKRGVDVWVICSDMSGNLREIEYLRKNKAQVEVVTAGKDKLFIHAKVYIADSKIAEVGSINMTTNSIDRNRELGIMTANPQVVKKLTETFLADWEKNAGK